MSNEADNDEERTHQDEVTDRVQAIKEEMASLQAAQAEMGVLQHKMRQEVMPIDTLISEIQSEVEDIQDDDFLTGKDEAEALREPPYMGGMPDALDLDDEYEDLATFKEDIEDECPGLDFSGEASSTLEQIADVLTDHLAGRQTFWQDRIERKQNEVEEARSNVNDKKSKLRKFIDRHKDELDTIPDVDNIEPDDDDGGDEAE